MECFEFFFHALSVGLIFETFKSEYAVSKFTLKRWNRIRDGSGDSTWAKGQFKSKM